jgi:hypothetical protein
MYIYPSSEESAESKEISLCVALNYDADGILTEIDIDDAHRK